MQSPETFERFSGNQELFLAIEGYGHFNPAYADKLSREAQTDLQAVFLDPKTHKPLSPDQIAKNVEKMVTSLVARTIQAEGDNPKTAESGPSTFLEIVQKVLVHPLDHKPDCTVEEIRIDPLKITDTLLKISAYPISCHQSAPTMSKNRLSAPRQSPQSKTCLQNLSRLIFREKLLGSWNIFVC